MPVIRVSPGNVICRPCRSISNPRSTEIICPGRQIMNRDLICHVCDDCTGERAYLGVVPHARVEGASRRRRGPGHPVRVVEPATRWRGWRRLLRPGQMTKRGRGRHSHTKGRTDRQTDGRMKQTKGQTRQKDRQAERQTDQQTHGQNRQPDTQSERQ